MKSVKLQGVDPACALRSFSVPTMSPVLHIFAGKCCLVTIENITETIFQKNLVGDKMESYTIKMSDVTPDAKFVLADIFISNSQNDHFTVTFSDRKDCLGTLYS